MRTISRALGTVLAVLVAAGAMVMLNNGSKAAIPAGVQETAVCTLNVRGMTCAGCAAAVKIAAKEVDGVKDANVSYESGLAEVTYDPAKTTPKAIAQAITEQSGFKAEAQVPQGK